MKAIPQRRVWMAAGVVSASALYLIITTLTSSGFAELPVRDVRSQSTLGRIKMNGAVVPGSAVYDARELTLRFTMADEQGDEIDVLFRGVKPNAFRDDAQVMIEGFYDAQADLVEAESLLAKCPSRYEEADQHPDDTAVAAAQEMP